jgi:hypothetical protein
MRLPVERRLAWLLLVAGCSNASHVTIASAFPDGAAPAVDLGAADLDDPPSDLAVVTDAAAAILDGATVTPSPDLAEPPQSQHDLLAPTSVDAAVELVDLAQPARDLAQPVLDLATPSASDSGTYVPPPPSDTPVAHAPSQPLTGARTLLGGQNVLDVSTDQGGGVWAITSTKVWYFPSGGGGPFTYDQSSGLARGQYQWTDTWFDPGTYPVTFASVAGATPGQAIVGNIGEIADRLQVNASNGAVVRIDNMRVTTANTTPDEFPEHVKRVVAVLRTEADLNGTLNGTAYLGGFHGFYAFHGLDADCGCLAFEEHQHYITDTVVGGGDVRALAFSPDGDVWQGDRDFVTLLPQRSKGARVGLFDYDFVVGRDVFPDVRDEVWGLGVDRSNGVYVASYGNGLAYLAPGSYAARYWSSATTLPQNHLTDVTVDGAGEAWITTREAGVARYNPAADSWTYYTNGLASLEINRVYVDKYSASRVIYFATANGITIYRP